MEGYSNTEILAVARWLVRSRLLDTLCEPDPQAAFDARIRDDFADMVESGLVDFAETAWSGGAVTVRIHADGLVFSFRAAVADGRVEIERRATCA